MSDKHRRWPVLTETAGPVFLAAILLGYLTWPVFHAFFIGEDLGAWGAMHDPQRTIWNVVFRPSSIFWRPAIALWFVVSDAVLPLDPVAFHIRNFVVTLVCVVLLYLILSRLVEEIWARLVGLSVFLVSKVHLTTVGCIEMVDSIATLVHALTTLYFLILYLQLRRRRYVWLSGAFYLLSLYSRDYTTTLLAVVAVLAYALERNSVAFSWRRLLRVLSPYGGLTVVYFITRWIAMRGTTPFAQAGNYAPTLDLNRALSHLVLYAGDFFNISLANPWIHGTGSFATLFGLPSPHTWERAFLVGGALLFLVTVVPALVRDARVWGGLCLTGAFIAPTLLVGLAQTYYLLVPLAGLAMALAVSLSAWSQGSRRVMAVLWTAVVLVCVVNCWVMRRNVEGLFWYSAGNAARQAYQSMIEPEKDRPIRSLTLMVADPSMVWYWKWVLDPFSTPGLVQALAYKPHLEFRVQEFDLTKARLLVGEVSPVYFLRDGTFAKFTDLVIKAGGPLQTRAGQPFNVQPDGTSAIWLQTENVPRSSVVILGDRRLPSMVAGTTAVSCTVPRDLYAKPGKYPIYVEDALTGRRSNALQFMVAP